MMLTGANNADKGAAEQLVGQTLLGNWKVQQRIRKNDGMSGGSRSACYRAVNETGDVAFIKAFDFPWQERGGDTDSLERMVREYNYEKNVHQFCSDKHLTRVTRIIDSGKISLNGETVHFLICEWADKCLREQQPPGESKVAASDRFAAMRDSTSALASLHQIGVAHQDLKPSNAVCSKGGLVKLTDLGSSSCENIDFPPHDLEMLVGQPTYAPYELLYESPPLGWRRRRFGCDLFLLGNLCFTSFVGVSLSVVALHDIPVRLRYTEFTGDYNEVMPHLIESHEWIVPAFLQDAVPKPLQDEVAKLINCLCHPNPSLRGHTKNLRFNNNQFGLERFIARFDLLSKKAKVIESGIH